MGKCNDGDAREIEGESRPFSEGQAPPVADQRAQNTGVGDDGNGACRQFAGDVCQFAGKFDGARLQHGDRFAAGRYEMQDVGCPVVDLLAGYVIPAFAFPIAKADFGEARIDVWRRVQGLGQPTCADQRTGKNGDTGRQQRRDTRCQRERIFAIDIELAVANPIRDQGTRMPDQENRHSKPA